MYIQNLDVTPKSYSNNNKKEGNILEIGEAKYSGEERSEDNSCKKVNLKQPLREHGRGSGRLSSEGWKLFSLSSLRGNTHSYGRVCGQIKENTHTPRKLRISTNTISEEKRKYEW